MRRRFTVWFVLVLIAHARAPVAFAQNAAPPFSLAGRILDATRAPIAGAHVTAVPDGQTSSPSALTDPRGSFTLLLMPGTYTLRVTADGFAGQSLRVTAPRTGNASREI